jgi:hypothetical protein
MRSLLLVLALLPLSVSAHGDAPSLEADVGDYMIDIGYTPELEAGTEIEFDIDLFTKEPIDYADFASVDVRVTKDGAEVVAGSVENDQVNIPTFRVTFPETGGYDMDIRYLDEQDRLIVARTFHLEVPNDAQVFVRGGLETAHYVIAAGLFALSLGIGGYALWERFGPKKKG